MIYHVGIRVVENIPDKILPILPAPEGRVRFKFRVGWLAKAFVNQCARRNPAL